MLKVIKPLTAAEQSIADDLLSHQLDLFRLDAHARQQALDLLDRLGSQLETMLRRTDITAWNKQRVEAQLRAATDIIDRYYTSITTTVNQSLAGVATVQASVVKSALDTALLITTDASVPTQTYLDSLLANTLIQGAKSSAWWKRQAGDTAFRFANSIRQGIAAGETIGQLATRIAGSTTQPGVMQASKWQARTLIHASVQAVSAKARRDTFAKNSDVIRGIQQVSTFDSHTTPICIAYGGARWTLDYKPMEGTALPYNGGVPRHWGCRSVEVPLTKSFKELGINIPEVPSGQRASEQGPVDAGMTFGEFLKRKGKAFQDEVLGPGRADLFRQGKITMQNLLDMKGNPLSVAQLRRKYG